MGRKKGSKNKNKVNTQPQSTEENKMIDGIVGGDYIEEGVEFIDPSKIETTIIEPEIPAANINNQVEPTIDYDPDNAAEIEDGLRDFLGGSQESIRHPKRRIIEEEMDYDEYDEPVRSKRSRRPRRQQTEDSNRYGFESSEDLLRQFRQFMLSDITLDPNFDIDELRDVLEDMLDMVELFSKQRLRKRKQRKITKGNKYVAKGLKPSVYDAVDDDEYYDDDDYEYYM